MAMKIIAKNKRAHFDYQLLEKVEAGLELLGTEVKSIRAGKVKIGETYIAVDKREGKKEAWIYNMYIAEYDFGNRNNHEETRPRKLLLHREQIETLERKVNADRLTIVPTILYFKDDKVKIELCVARGKKDYDKRQDQKQKDVERNLRRGIYD